MAVAVVVGRHKLYPNLNAMIIWMMVQLSGHLTKSGRNHFLSRSELKQAVIVKE